MSKKTTKKPCEKTADKKTKKCKSQSTKTGLFKFRRYKKEEGGKQKKAKHPKLIVDEEQDNYGFMGLTEAPKRGHHKNIELNKNPQKGKSNKAYLRDELRYDSKRNFSKVLEEYNLSEEDKLAVIEYIKKKKKKK